MKTLYLLCVGCWLIVGCGWAQSSAKDADSLKHTLLTVRMYDGIVVPHHQQMMYFIDHFSHAVEVNYGIINYASGNWASYFNYPEVGVGFFYGTFGNKEVYGEGLALFPYINYSFVRGQRFTMQNKVSMGVGYATRPFNIDNNTDNTIFSTHFNVYLGFAMIANYRVSPRLSLTSALALTHMSNGAIKKPNHGINTFTLGLGATYHFNERDYPLLPKVVAPDSHQRDFIVTLSGGQSQSVPFNTERCWSGVLNLNYMWYLNAKRAVGVGFDQFYSEAAPYVWDRYDDYDPDVQFTTKHYIFNGVFVSYNVFLGRTTLFTNLGAYLYSYIKPSQPIYPRIGVRHLVTKHLVASFSVKASFFRSEFLEFGLGYRLPFNQTKYNP